jgi:hypothetical protein
VNGSLPSGGRPSVLAVKRKKPRGRNRDIQGYRSGSHVSTRLARPNHIEELTEEQRQHAEECIAL